jgi:hypothetical protein
VGPFRKLGLVGILTALAASFSTVDAQAASYEYTLSAVGPTIYQTNFWYNGTLVNSPTGVPSTNVINSISWSFPSYNAPSGVTINYQICDTQRCVSTTALSGNSTSFAGDPGAGNSFQVNVYAGASTTKVLSPSLFGSVNNLYVYTG